MCEESQKMEAFEETNLIGRVDDWTLDGSGNVRFYLYWKSVENEK